MPDLVNKEVSQGLKGSAKQAARTAKLSPHLRKYKIYHLAVSIPSPCYLTEHYNSSILTCQDSQK